ncbi:hypothetical protein [Yoonia sp. 2307UL14-13]|uniref:hypothetical protein n=1 Tax=Yoonia sp. 2307UL14-13 TaxID=3126506 RepID=UPI0030A8C3D2
MSSGYLIAALALATMGLAIGFTMWSKKRTEERLHKDAPKSSLAKDGPGPQPFR